MPEFSSAQVRPNIQLNSVPVQLNEWLKTAAPQLLDAPEFTLLEHPVPGRKESSYVRIISNGICRGVLRFSEGRDPELVFPMDWEKKPNIVPGVAFWIIDALQDVAFAGKDVLDLGCGDFAFFALMAAQKGCRSAVGVEF